MNVFAGHRLAPPVMALGVTLITGIPMDDKELKAFAKVLKARCGTGGTVKEGTVEIQGDQRDLLVPLLKEKGWTVKRSGG